MAARVTKVTETGFSNLFFVEGAVFAATVGCRVGIHVAALSL